MPGLDSWAAETVGAVQHLPGPRQYCGSRIRMDARQFGDPNPDPHKSEKPDADPRQSRTPEVERGGSVD